MRRATIFALLALLAGAGFFLLYNNDPESASFYPKCPSRSLFGVYCPGCGSTRALYHLAHFNISGALAKNPLLVISIPFIVLLMAYPKLRLHPNTPWVCFAILVGYGILRNVDNYPFTLLAPH